MFSVALFTTAKTWKQPVCLSTDEWIKEGNIAIYDNMHGAGGHYAKQNMQDTEREILHDITYIYNLK